jgi:thiamine-phosphate pyrophosphorylase
MASFDRHGTLRETQLYVLLDLRRSRAEFAGLVQAMLSAGVRALQLRDKQANDRELLAGARLLRALTRERNTLCVINDRPDIAVLADADGVHLGQEDLSVADARRIVGKHRIIGVSTHDVGQVRQARGDGADYIGCGPTFASETKQFAQFPGLAFLREIAPVVSCPAFAIGGIRRGNLPEVLQVGFCRVAVSGGVISAEDPGREAQRLVESLQSSPVAASRSKSS